jgi:glycosyltransferase involved in cell wall biosynthesis
MKVLVVRRKFHNAVGGVGRVCAAMMNDLVKRGHQTALLTLDQTDAVPFYPLDDSVEWIRLAMGDQDRRASWRLRWQRQLSIRRYVKKLAPDVIVGFEFGSFLIVRTAVFGMNIPVIAAEQSVPDRYDYLPFGWRKHIEFLAFLLASRVTVLLPSFVKKYPAYLRSKIVAIPNPVVVVPGLVYPNEQENPPKIVLNVGRLAYQKNQLFLLRAFARVAVDHPDWRLVIVGDGKMAEVLQRAAGELNLHGRVVFTGAVKDVSAWYDRAAFLAFPSLWEGFGIALAEALAHGLPAVGLRTAAAVNELITDGVTGMLTAPTEEAFADAMNKMIDDLPSRQRMGRAAVQSVQAYAPGKIFDQWESLFRSLASRR